MAKPQVESLRSVLQRIRDDAEEAISLLAAPPGVRALAWRCLQCGSVKYFTRPALKEVAPPCPKCKGVEFVPR